MRPLPSLENHKSLESIPGWYPDKIFTTERLALDTGLFDYRETCYIQLMGDQIKISVSRITSLSQIVYFFVIAGFFVIVWSFSGNNWSASAELSSRQYISLTDGANDYTIENDYYKAVIPKPSAGAAIGVVKHLYIKKSDNTWSADLVYQGNANYCLGYLEGGNSGSSGNNSSYGMQNSVATTVTVTENTASRVVITATYDNGFTDFSEAWTFWAKKPYFQSVGSIVAGSTYQTNQFQMAWMVNSSLPISWYGTDKDGNIESYSSRVTQQVHSPNLNTYPWLNWQFTGEAVSLGMLFTDVNSKYTAIGETGDMPFEYQLNFQLGGGSGGNPAKSGYARTLTTLYYTTSSASNTPIQNFASNAYQNASISNVSEPILQAAATASNAFAQNTGVSSSLVNSPYFLLRQNSQNRHTGIEWPQYATTIYAPLYKYWDVIHAGSYDYKNQLQFTLNYANDSTSYTYGTISSATANNSSTVTSIEHVAASSDTVLNYDTTFTTWNDSDKLQITGTTSNGTPSAPVKDIYMSLAPAYTYTYEAETATPTSSITSTLGNNDNLWTDYTLYSFDSGSTLIFRDNGENVPPVSIPIAVPNGTYDVRAYVNQRTEGSLTYNYSTNGVDYSSFVVAAGGTNGSYNVDLGLMTVNGAFYINDDDSSSGIAGYGGWDKIVLTPAFVSLGSNVYDLRLEDPIYGTVGIAVKINSPTNNIVNGVDLRIYTYKQASAQTLTTFSYPFDVEIYPHTGSLTSATDFTGLHNQNVINYSKRNFYLPQNIHSGRTNTVYPNGVIAYSADPYNSNSVVNLAVTPTGDFVDVTIDIWNTSGTYYKRWTEYSPTSTTTSSHTVGSLKANTSYNIKVGGAVWQSVTSDSSGSLSFNYNAGYSTKTFEVEEVPASAPAETGSGSTAGSTKKSKTKAVSDTIAPSPVSNEDTAAPAIPSDDLGAPTEEPVELTTASSSPNYFIWMIISAAVALVGLGYLFFRFLVVRDTQEETDQTVI